MNYLSHQAVAEAVAPDADAYFFVGNILPDLLSAAGSRMREKDLRNAAPASPQSQSLIQGIQLHFATDIRFHGHAVFKEAMEEAGSLLRTAHFTRPLTRVFFLSHILVEIALDGELLQREPGIADRLYSALETVGSEKIAQESVEVLGVPDALPDLTAGIQGFMDARYLTSYRTYSGQAEALARVLRRVEMTDLLSSADRKTLSQVLEAFAPQLARWEAALLTPPSPRNNPVVQ